MILDFIVIEDWKISIKNFSDINIVFTFGNPQGYSSNYWVTIWNHEMVNSDEGKKGIDYINNASPNLFIASIAIKWKINSNKSDFQITLAYFRKLTMHLPNDIPFNGFYKIQIIKIRIK